MRTCAVYFGSFDEKFDEKADIEHAYFHGFFTDSELVDSTEVALYPIAIVELENGRVITTNIKDIKFLDKPEPPGKVMKTEELEDAKEKLKVAKMLATRSYAL